MPDNVAYTPGSGATIAADDIGGVLYQRVKVIHGADGVANETADNNPLPIYQRDNAATTSFSAVTAANTVLFTALEMSNEKSVAMQLVGNWSGAVLLQQSNDNTNWGDVLGSSQSNSSTLVSEIYSPDVVVVQVAARYFRAITSPNFVGSVSGNYVARWVELSPSQVNVSLVESDADLRFRPFALTPQGYQMGLRVNEAGGLILADNQYVTGSLSRIGAVVQLETTGYNSVSVQVVPGPVAFSGTITFQVSNDGSTWNSVLAWPVAGGTAPVTSTTASGQWLIPSVGRFFRAQVTVYTSGIAVVVAVLKNQNAWQPQATPSVTIAANSAVNVAQIAGGAPAAEDAAAGANPLIVGGVVRTALPASTVVAGDAIRETYSQSGQLITKENAPGDLDFYVNATVTTATQTALRAAQASPIRQNVTGLTFQNTNATATTLTIQDGSTTLVTFSVPASMTLPVQLNFPTPLRGTAATALNYTAGTTGANILINVIGFNSY
jgi:hypothetical protein